MSHRFTIVLVLTATSLMAAAQEPTPKPAPRDPQRELATSVADGFTVAAVGDCIIARAPIAAASVGPCIG